MRALITGCNGFVGRYLSEYLQSVGREIIGIDVQEKSYFRWMEYRSLDISKSHELKRFYEKIFVDEIYHLAAVANTRTANKEPQKAVDVNVGGTTNLCELVRQNRDVKLLVIGTSQEYKVKSGSDVVYVEDDQLEAGSIYGASKICAELIGLEYQRQYDLDIYFTRSFNHSGPGQESSYVLSDFAKQCVEIKFGRKEAVLNVGNIDVSRDFLDVRDVVSAYVDIVTKGEAGEVYNVCSGKTYLLRDLLKILISYTGRHDIKVHEDLDRIRNKDPFEIRGDNTKLTHQTRWRQRVAVQTMLKDLFLSWEEYLLRQSKV